MKKTRFVVVSGTSGSGKSTALNFLEDIGFYCVNNLPVTFLPEFLRLGEHSDEISKMATVIDVREGEFLKEFPSVLAELKESGYKVDVLFLDASDDSLIRRFSETRRRHPLTDARSPAEGVAMERELLSDVRSRADRVLDTTNLTVHELKKTIRAYFSGSVPIEKVVVNLTSFGFRYGIPPDADIVMDVRFLPNPYFVDALRQLTGTDPTVSEYVLARPETRDFIDRFKDFMRYLIPLYCKEGKTYLTVAIGCTGGKHRSVAIVEALFEQMDSETSFTRHRHRDIEKP